MSRHIPHTASNLHGDLAWNDRNQHGTRLGKQIASLTLVLTLFVVSGCEEARVPVFPVSGRVTFNGKPPVGAQVVLHAASPSDIDDTAPSGLVQSDGSFNITVYEPGDGAPQGDYVATVQWFKLVSDGGGSGAGPNVLPKKYANPATSPIKVSVASGPVQVPSITIK